MCKRGGLFAGPLCYRAHLSPAGDVSMIPNDFRRLALSFPETEECAHMDHPDFRVAGKIFATLGYPEDGWAMVKLTPVEQQMFIKAQPTSSTPARVLGDAAAPPAFA